ncbi:YiiX/YebB-like N1pC/P60 family cysteine hydrolase [Bacillus atrophaeus]|uniref:YiiX/YebB-like N1pC/P60 family cysteine hydrolase n=1 Tax=Bacillus atrophaeus TaxID=1452 RepID=UPI0022818DB2|nr:YiiX/YebB-like N1pC/P60 family cysteine hydrolase [Bacillus atrophaeus]MCY8466848.1 hypothetical protein [Bacillus atrophaeus]MCY8475811.1 hypothetical protein [Bacillus atrophaeus]
MGTSKFTNVNVEKYENLLNSIKTGDVFLCSGNYLVSELIKKASNSMFSHVGLLLRWNDQLLLIESVEDDGVRMIPLEHYIKNYENTNRKYNGTMFIARHKQIESISDGDEKINTLIDKGLSLLNRNYDKKEIARIIARIGLGIGKHEDNDEYICSELVYECFNKIGVKFSIEDDGFIFPEHIAADQNIFPIAQIE